MTSCNGCGTTLGWKKYKFHKMWRIPGYFCKPCMIELGKDFDSHARLTLPTKHCDLCNSEFFFLRTVWQGKKQKHFCEVCANAVKSGAIPDNKPGTPPKRLPHVLMIFAGLGVLMMVMGLVFTLMATGSEGNVINVLFGAVTTALGFVLFKKTIKSRSLLQGRLNQTEIDLR